MARRLVLILLALAVVGCGAQSGGSGAVTKVNLRFVHERAMPSSRRVDVPGSGKLQMGLVEGRIQSTGKSVGGEALVLVAATLKIDRGAPVGEGRILCSVHPTASGSRIARSAGFLRATYPRASDVGIYDQAVPEPLVMRLSSHPPRLAVLEVEGLPDRFTTIKGVSVAWPRYEPGTERLRYRLPKGTPKRAIELPFFTVWRARTPAPTKVACTLTDAAGTATVATEG